MLKLIGSANSHESFYPWEFLESYLHSDKPELELAECVPFNPRYIILGSHR